MRRSKLLLFSVAASLVLSATGVPLVRLEGAPSHQSQGDGSIEQQPSPPQHEDGGIVEHPKEPEPKIVDDAGIEVDGYIEPEVKDVPAHAKQVVLFEDEDEEPTGKKIHEGDVGALPKEVERTDIRNNIRHQLEDAGLEPDSMDAQLRHQAVEDQAEAANFDEPALLDEDEMLYKDQELAEMEGYQPEAELDEANKETDEEYKRYLDEMTEEMLNNVELRHDIITEYKQMVEEIEKGGKHDSEAEDLYKIAQELFDTDARSKLEEQERDILNRQRRGAKEKMHHEEKLDHKANDFDFHDPDAFLWTDGELDASHKARFMEIAERRAKLLKGMDENRRAAFLDHEMARLLEYRELVQQTTDPEKKKSLIAAHKDEQDSLNRKIGHEPGRKKQLEDVWERDGFEKDTFDTKTLFKMHDTNEDGFWDLKEIEAMMWDEASKLHEAIAKNKGGGIENKIDKYAVKEEMARMRDHLVGTMDADGDMMISSEEFLTASGKKDFKEDKAWKPVNPEKEVEEEKLAEFDKHRKAIKKSKHKNLPPDMIDIARKKMAELPDIAKLKHKLGSFNVKELAKTAHKSIKQAASKHLKKMKAGLKGALGGDQLKEVDRKVREGLKDAAETAKMKEAR